MKVRGIRPAIENRLRRKTTYGRVEYWDGKAEQLEGRAVSMWKNNHLNDLFHEEQVREAIGELGDLGGLRVLDAGCGSGRLSRHFAARGADVTGVDFSPATIAVARRETDGDNPRYRVQSVYEIEAIAEFDVIALVGTVSVACKDAADLADVLRRLHRALKPDGRILIIEPIHRGFLQRVLDVDRAQFLAVTRDSGFEIRKVIHLHFWPTRLLLSYVNWPRLVTRLIYGIGNFILDKVLRRRRGGDYQAILATAAPTTRPAAGTSPEA